MSYDPEMPLDDVGWEILKALQENARISFTELGRRVGLSQPAVGERVRRLEDAGIITGYHAHVNLEKVGLPITAFVRISAVDVNCLEISNIAKSIPEVIECHRVTGGDSAIMKVVVSSVSHLETLLDQLMRYGNSTTSIVLSTSVAGKVIERRT